MGAHPTRPATLVKPLHHHLKSQTFCLLTKSGFVDHARCRSGDNPPGYASGDMPACNDRCFLQRQLVYRSLIHLRSSSPFPALLLRQPSGLPSAALHQTLSCRPGLQGGLCHHVCTLVRISDDDHKKFKAPR